jgi:TolB-like protein/DNA-binding winged helix-turn-helix (wHTH) protein/Tfp pilus assembly protein PilF
MKVPETIKFDEDFELDLRAYELRRTGRAVKLERIPMQVLLLLIEQRGQLVTREQIAERIWGKGAFLDTDNSINGAIRKVRSVLRDDPEDPRFIQTLTGRGYRFIAPVVESQVAETPVIESSILETQLIAAEDERDTAATSPSVSGSQEVAVPELASRGRWRWPNYLGAALVVAVIASLALWFRWSRSPSPSPAPGGRLMLAVLPFENLTGDAGQDYFSDGLTEEMIAQLGRLDPQHLGVIARTSVMHYKSSHEPLAEISRVSRELGAQYVLEGSVRRDSKRVRINAQLIQVRDQSNVWTQQYDRELQDVLVIEGDIAREIASETQRALGTQKMASIGVPATLSRERYEAYDLYLKGLYFLNKRSAEGFAQAIPYFQQATEKDPSYAAAYAGLADSYALMAGYTGAPPADFASKARVAALRAVELDDNSAEAHTALALIVQNYDYDWQTSEKEFQRAIELNPNYATAHHWYAEHLMWLGRFDEALRESDVARQIDPLSLIIATDRGVILLYSHQTERAIEQLTALREMDPAFLHNRVIEDAYLQLGMPEKVRSDVEGWPVEDSTWYWSEMAYFEGRAGRPKQAKRALERLLDLSRRQLLDPIVLVPAYLGNGNRDAAIASLQEAYRQHSNGLTSLKVNPYYDVLRSDPRFQDLQKRVGLQ